MTNLFLIAILLPLLLVGRGEKATVESVAEVKPESVSVNAEELEIRETIWYLKGSDVPYTGKAFKLYENGQKQAEDNFKDGKRDGVQLFWHQNGQKRGEETFKEGKKEGQGIFTSPDGKK